MTFSSVAVLVWAGLLVVDRLPKWRDYQDYSPVPSSLVELQPIAECGSAGSLFFSQWNDDTVRPCVPHAKFFSSFCRKPAFPFRPLGTTEETRPPFWRLKTTYRACVNVVDRCPVHASD